MKARDETDGGAGDRELVEGLQAGDADAFERLVRAESGRLLAVARRLVGGEDEARDVVQEAFLAAFRSIGGFRGGARLSTWLHRIAVNAALMRLRSRRRRPEESIEDHLPRFQEDGHAVRPSEDWSESVDRQLERRQLQELVRGFIDELPENYRTVLLLRDIEEMDTRESAQVLGISENAVKVRLHRARQALRERLDGHLRGATE